jgi:hypothetical protein
VPCAFCGATDDTTHSVQLGHDVCLSCYGARTPPSPPPDPGDRPLMRFVAHETRRKRRADRERAALAIDELAACERIAAEAHATARRAMVDPVIHVVLTECPHCDSDGTWLPYQIVPRWDVTIFRCQSCGYRRVDDRRAR